MAAKTDKTQYKVIHLGPNTIKIPLETMPLEEGTKLLKTNPENTDALAKSIIRFNPQLAARIIQIYLETNHLTTVEQKEPGTVPDTVQSKLNSLSPEKMIKVFDFIMAQ